MKSMKDKKETKKRRNIMLRDSRREKAKRIGKCSVSAGIEKAIDAYKE